jgi:tRNA(fMet)-specific endonuclease VapC
MAKYLLDTNVCVFYLRGKYDVDKKIKDIGGLTNCIISEITLAELKYGAEISDRHGRKHTAC